jgi:hypothetical protein
MPGAHSRHTPRLCDTFTQNDRPFLNRERPCAPPGEKSRENNKPWLAASFLCGRVLMPKTGALPVGNVIRNPFKVAIYRVVLPGERLL